jgi:mTERF domain-containing protein
LSNSSISKYLGNVDELLTVTPELSRYPVEQWEKSFNTLRRIGFNATRFAQMASQHPKILIKTEDKISAAMNQWRGFNFGEKQTFQLLERYPELLEVRNFHLTSANLGVINSFVGQKNGYKVLRNSPNVATEQTDLLTEKIEYLQDIMRVDPVEVYKSDVFSYDLLKIKTRHVFLERLGMYFKKKKGDKNDAHEINKNPKLSKIMDSSDKRFATKVCHVTLEEYETFVEIYKEELDKKEGRYQKPFEEEQLDEKEN